MKNPRGVVAVIIAFSIGLAILLSLAWTLGPWTPAPEESIAMEVLALVAAGLGAISVYLGMSNLTPPVEEENPLMNLDDDTPEDDPEADLEDEQFKPDED